MCHSVGRTKTHNPDDNISHNGKQDANTLAAFEAFDSSKDVSSLVESIKAILQE